MLASELELLVLLALLVVALFCGGLGGLDTTATGVGGGDVDTAETDIGRLLNLVSPSLTGRQPRLHEADR
ncbi:hypothetical protein [Bradyrhizobium sp.]|uniref:hypothetical protein n=1 Tax=Bradyrhizobium sp. TaxID=376 RepID=UPI003C37693D